MLHLIDSTATASTNISNYFCALWPERRIELFTNVVEISQSSPRRLFICHFRQMFFFIIWQAALHIYGELDYALISPCGGGYGYIQANGELTDSFFWLVEFSAGILVSQITDFYFANHWHIFIITDFYFANHQHISLFLFCK